MKEYIKVAGFIRYIPAEILVRVLLGLLVTGTWVAQAFLLSRGCAYVFAHAPFARAASCYLAVLGLIVVRALLVRFSEGYTKKAAGKIKTIIREILLEKLFMLGPGYQMNKRSGKLQSLLTDGVEYLEPYLVGYIPQIFIVAASVIPMVLYIFTLNTWAGGILCLAVLLAIFMPHLMFPLTSRASVGYWRGYAVLNSQYVDTMQGMNTLKVFHAEKRRGEELAADSEAFRVEQTRNTRNSLVSSAAITLMMSVGTSVTTTAAAYLGGADGLGYAALLNIMFLSIECVRPIGDMNNAWHSSYLALSVSREFSEIMEEPVRIKNIEGPRMTGLSGDLPEISFEHVSFSYSKKRESALEDVSFVMEPGKTAAFVGASGSGKSTIVNLLLRFYDADEGRILLNGVDIRDYDLEYLRSRIAVVFQSTYLFYGTIRDNIRMACPDATEEEVIEAAKAANAHDFIQSLEQGYDTLVGERGARLSGGQRQRIAIARAILKKASILIMDEATSSVDAASERMIQETVEGIQGKFTVLLIAHRLSTIQHAERIYVLSEGGLAESGSHRELLRKKAEYARLIEAQNREVTRR